MKILVLICTILMTTAGFGTAKEDKAAVNYNSGVLITKIGKVAVVGPPVAELDDFQYGFTYLTNDGPKEKVLEMCDRENSFQTNPLKIRLYKRILAAAAERDQEVTVRYFDNGHPLAGMCIDTIKISELQSNNTCVPSLSEKQEELFNIFANIYDTLIKDGEFKTTVLALICSDVSQNNDEFTDQSREILEAYRNLQEKAEENSSSRTTGSQK